MKETFFLTHHPLPTIQTFTPCHPTPQTLFLTTTRHHEAYRRQKLLPFTSSTTSASRRPDIFKIFLTFRRIQPLTYILVSPLSFYSYIFNLSICLAVEKEEKD